jgi:hypothetical protein
MQMQLELVSSRYIFCPVTNDLNSGHCGHPQYGTNENWGLLPNATDDEPRKKLVSVKDSASDARLANAQVGGNSQDIVYYLALKVFPGNLKLG